MRGTLWIVLAVMLWGGVVAAQTESPRPAPTRPQPTPTVTLSPVFTESRSATTPEAPLVTPAISLDALQGTATFMERTFDAYFDASTQSPATGEPFTLTLNIAAPPDYTLTLPDFEATWGEGFTVLRVGELETVSTQQAERTLYTVEMEVVAWGLGQYSTPLTRIGANNGVVDALVTVEPFFLSIPVVVDDARELRISRAVMRLFHLPVWAVVLAATLGAGGLFGVVRVVRQRAQHTGNRLTAKVQRTIGGRTVQALHRLSQNAPDWIARYVALGDILRVYIAERFGVPPDLTTNEALDLLRDREAPLPDLDTLAYLLEQADLAKFAPGAVLNPSEKPIVELGVSWVRATEKAQRSQGRG